MDRYAPELSVLRLKRRRSDDDQLHSHLPPSKKVAQTLTRTLGFMRLPAELHNRIYDYVAEEAPSQPLVPVERSQLHKRPDQRATGIALTQVSRQIRSEYRPILLSQATFIIDWHATHAFLEAFFPNENEYGSGPKELIIQYDTNFNCTLTKPTDITHLARLGLAFKGLEVCVLDDADDAGLEYVGRSFTDFLQFGCIHHISQLPETDAETEARQKWRRAILDGKLTSIFATIDWETNQLVFVAMVSKEAVPATGLVSAEAFYDEFGIEGVNAINGIECSSVDAHLHISVYIQLQ